MHSIATQLAIRVATRLASPALALMLAGAGTALQAQTASPPPAFDEALARSSAADDYGMRRYVLVILKSSPTPLPNGPARDEMFKGHFANINRLAAEGKLALAGPLDGVEGRRGIFVLAVSDLDEAKRLVASDPVIAQGEMLAEYHRFYGSAALIQVNTLHPRLAKKSF